MINLREYSNKTEIINLLSDSMGASEERVLLEYEIYMKENNRSLLGTIVDDELVALLGIIHCNKDEVELKHIAVKEKYRNRGYGRVIVEEYIKNNKFKSIKAETDKDAVNFYKKLGFTITSLGEKYPGVERFKCVISLSKPS